MKQTRAAQRVRIGIDLGDRRHRFCVLGSKGEVVEEGSLGNEREEFSRFMRRYPGSLVIVEASTHSPWISRYLSALGCKVIVANPRKVRAIYQDERKNDRRDALMLARIGRMEPALLHPIQPGREEAQRSGIWCGSSCEITWCELGWE